MIGAMIDIEAVCYMNSKVTLFLDLDGVLIITKSWDQDMMAEDGYSIFHPMLVKNLNTLLEKWNFEIVLSSSRRKDRSLEEFNQIFRNRGIHHSITAYTPISTENLSRKQEIEKYINENNVQNFIILDDDKCLNELDAASKEKLVLTKTMLGFTKDKLEEAIEKLNAQIKNGNNL